MIGKTAEPVESRHSFSSDDSPDGKCHMNEEQRQMKLGVQKSRSAQNIPMGMCLFRFFLHDLWIFVWKQLEATSYTCIYKRKDIFDNRD